jgi:hypothetical protein
MYYFLSGTTNPTRYSTMMFNLKVGTRMAGDEVLQNLDQHQVKYVLWDRAFDVGLANDLFPGAHSQRIILAPYLDSHYKPIWSHDGTFLMERRDDK